ncbi:MAG TPA: CoA-transferase [Streptosporangiaceae bacterium]|nr:CoA-transferase [Streptosporangiaceae bacterium]
MHKLVTAAEAVARFVTPGAVVGMGGQNINRCPMALVHEVARQGLGDLAVVGCNLSVPLDILVACGLVARTEHGSGNLERYGTLFAWRRAAEAGSIEVRDHSHLAMATRFAAGAIGVPFMPTRSLLGTDVLRGLIDLDIARLMEFDGQPIVLMRALTPDVSLIHVHQADPLGNAVIEGVTSHEVDMVRASRATIISAEEIVPPGSLGERPERVTISEAYVSAVVHQPYGAYPTSVYRRYDFAEDEIKAYQAVARAGGAEFDHWIRRYVLEPERFDDYLDRRDPDAAGRLAMSSSMRSMV